MLRLRHVPSCRFHQQAHLHSRAPDLSFASRTTSAHEYRPHCHGRVREKTTATPELDRRRHRRHLDMRSQPEPSLACRRHLRGPRDLEARSVRSPIRTLERVYVRIRPRVVLHPQTEGSVTTALTPRGVTFFNSRLPPWARTISRAIARPRPLPLLFGPFTKRSNT